MYDPNFVFILFLLVTMTTSKITKPTKGTSIKTKIPGKNMHIKSPRVLFCIVNDIVIIKLTVCFLLSVSNQDSSQKSPPLINDENKKQNHDKVKATTKYSQPLEGKYITTVQGISYSKLISIVSL